jgi:hypothetical protein
MIGTQTSNGMVREEQPHRQTVFGEAKKSLTNPESRKFSRERQFCCY